MKSMIFQAHCCFRSVTEILETSQALVNFVLGLITSGLHNVSFVMLTGCSNSIISMPQYVEVMHSALMG